MIRCYPYCAVDAHSTQIYLYFSAQKTVIAILDCLINPDWPYTPVEEKKDADEMWSKMPDVPIRYHFYYRILDGDECGRPAKIKYTQDDGVEVEILNPRFNHKEKSCLQSLCESEHSEVSLIVPCYLLWGW